MTDLDQLLHLIRRDGLASIRPGSKDPLATHSEHFAKALARYLAATQATYADAVQRGGAIDMSIVEEPANQDRVVVRGGVRQGRHRQTEHGHRHGPLRALDPAEPAAVGMERRHCPPP